MSIADEARAEAERRYRLDAVNVDNAPNLAELNERVAAGNGFIAGARWQASRKPEAAPSDTDDREALIGEARRRLTPGGYAPSALLSLIGRMADALSQPVQAPSDTEALALDEAARVVRAYPSRVSEHVASILEERAASRRAARTSQPAPSDTDEVFAILDDLNASNQIGYDDYSRLHDAVSRASQPVQVEVTDEQLAQIQKAAEVAVMNEQEARTGYGFSGSPEARRAGLRAVANAQTVEITDDKFGGHAAIALGIEDGLREAGAELHGCTPSMLVLAIQKRIAAERSLIRRSAALGGGDQ